MPDEEIPHHPIDLHRPEEEELLTVPQAAELLEISAPTVYIAMREGRLPFVVKYDKRLISIYALAEYRVRTRPTGKKPRGRPPRNPQSDAE